MPLQATSGAASYDAFGGGVPVEPVYTEQIFSTYLYTGTSANRSIINNIDLAGKGGLVWIKTRSEVWEHYLADTVRGTSKASATNNTSPESTGLTNGLTSFNSNGFSLGIDTDTEAVNRSPKTYVSWTFREQPKFFDVVMYTGNGSSTQTISHNLGVTPGCIMVKKTSGTSNWSVYHRSLTAGSYVKLNLTDAQAADSFMNGANAPTSTTFTAQLATSDGLNANGATYVAYIFAHNAGGFGLTGTDNVISCGSWTGTGTSPGPTTTLGYEPQWIIWKRTDAGTESWHIRDNMRGMPVTASGKDLYADSSSAEGSTTNEGPIPTATGFQIIGTNTNANASGGTYIYIAIRRGPMAVPTLGTSIFAAYDAPDTTLQTVGFPTDMYFDFNKTGSTYNVLVGNRLVGTTAQLFTQSTAAESNTYGPSGSFASNTSFSPAMIGSNAAWYSFRRAPGFFDVVCYTGTGADPQTVSHNLGKAPELMIFKARGVAAGWRVWGGNMAITEYLALSETSAVVTGSTFFGSTTPTATSFYVGSGLSVSGRTHVAYLFATAAGVSKVFSYTGNGSSQTINCGFTGGARFVLIKRTDSTGDWYVWDTARGIVAGNDPHLSLNTTSAEVTTDDTIDTDSTGFVVNQVSATNVNVSSATYIGFAVA